MPFLGVALLAVAFIVNISGNKVIGKSSQLMAILKVGGIVIFALGGLAVSHLTADDIWPVQSLQDYSPAGYVGAIALSILAYKGFTTITNSGGEITHPHRNVGRAIVISLLICTVVYLLVAFSVAANLPVPQIVAAKNYSLAEAARPAFGSNGLYFTVAIAIIATVSGVIASIFAVSRMTAMLTEMKLIPHSHFGMPGSIQKHMLVYALVVAFILTIFFDLSRIASMGAIFYLVMDMMVHWGVLRKLRAEVKASAAILVTALVLDAIVLGALIWVKASVDMTVVIVSVIGMIAVFSGEFAYLKWRRPSM